MTSRLGNVIYWFCLLIMTGCLCAFVYQFIFNSVTPADYKQYLSWTTYDPQTWDAYVRDETGNRNAAGLGYLSGGVVAWLIGKAIQYILGGKWQLRDFIHLA